MKRIAVLVATIALLSSAASAGGLTFGAKGGIYTANTTQVPAGWDNTYFKNGLAGGVCAHYVFSEYFGLQSEVLYVQKGFDGDISNRFYAVTFTGTYDYIVIPILAKLTFASANTASPHVLAGPSIGFNIKADTDIDILNRVTRESASGTLDYSDVTNALEVGLVFGAGVGIKAGPGRITVDGRFDLGLTKITKGGTVTGKIGDEDIVDEVPSSNNKNIGFALMLGYAF